MNKPKVLITDPAVPKVAFDLLSEIFDVITCDEAVPSRNDILSKIQGIDALFWCTKNYLNKEMLDAAGPQLRVVSTMSVGYDHIDIEEVKSQGILIGNTAGAPTRAVADLSVMLTLAACRRLHEGWMQMTAGMWDFAPNWLLGQDIGGSTIGIVGLGAIGQDIIKRFKGFDVAKFLYCGHKEKPEGAALGAIFVPFDELLVQSDVIIATCPYSSETHEMFNAAAFNKMKPTSVFVNVSRGKVVDQEALVEALENKTIFAAGLDVMTPEPLPPNHKLYSLPNCVLIPHLGSATVNTRKEMAILAAKNILAVYNNTPMPSPL